MELGNSSNICKYLGINDRSVSQLSVTTADIALDVPYIHSIAYQVLHLTLY